MLTGILSLRNTDSLAYCFRTTRLLWCTVKTRNGAPRPGKPVRRTDIRNPLRGFLITEQPLRGFGYDVRDLCYHVLTRNAIRLMTVPAALNKVISIPGIFPPSLLYP